MKAISLWISMHLVALSGATHAQEEASPPTPETGGLQRLAPEERGKGPLEDLFARDFDPTRWRARLTTPDLDQRERSFEILLQRARLDPPARAFVEELARDPNGGEAAWTARLALRELGRARFPMQGGSLTPDALGGAMLGNGARTQQWMKELFAQDGLALKFAPGLPGGRGASAAQGTGRSVRVEQGENGALVRITETVDGTERPRTYSGTSLEEILRTNPGLADELDRLGFHANRPLGPASGSAGLELAPQGLSRPVRTDRLGVVVAPLELARAQTLGLEREGQAYGLRVERVLPGTFASLLGVRAGDVLVELDGITLRTGDEIGPRIRQRAADEALTLIWMDELGQRQTKSWRPAAPKAR